jgi:hypothetical protein
MIDLVIVLRVAEVDFVRCNSDNGVWKWSVEVALKLG